MTTHTPNLLSRAPQAKNAIVARGRLGLVVAAGALGGLTAAGSSAATPRPQTLRVLEVATSFVGTGGFNATGHTPPAVGQGVVIKASLFQVSNHKPGVRYGLLHIRCTFTNSTGASVCTAIASLPAGKLVVSGLSPGNSTKPYTLPILGGSGRYAGARGHIAIKPIGNSNKATDTIVITG